jgi:hypothetical protein
MTAATGDLLTTRNATIDDLVVLLRDQQARKVDVVASASSVRAEGGCLILDGTMREWLRHVSVIAAYRDQHKVTTDDPRQVLGPYTETGRAGHRAYWHAAESVLAARQLAGLEPANGTSADDRARAQTAADIYRSLPDHERADIAAAVAAAPDTTWLGDPAGPDEHAATQPGYAPQLIAKLTRDRHLTAASDPFPQSQPVPDGEPWEAQLARRGRPGQGRPERPHGTSPEPAARSDRGPLQQVLPRHDSPAIGRTPHR